MASSVDLKPSYDRFFTIALIHPPGEKVQEIIDGKLIFKSDRLQVKILKSRALKTEKLICEFLEIRGGFFNVWSNW
ncbi:hypothetical protein AM228_18345 [Planktothricoides sp. SR001]|nr:hypothetical protein AM228_18345 [Planktothricoides sp. SR001]